MKPGRSIGDRLRETAIGFGLAAVATTATLAVVEAFLRVQEPHLHLMNHGGEPPVGRYEVHPIWHHWMRPGQRTRQPTHDPVAFPEPIVYTTNELGCRDDRPIVKTPGLYRILVLGDSFTEGYYFEESFSRTLERRLNGVGTPRYEVMNCGTSSYSPLLHYLRYSYQLHELEADEVIINVDLTDVYDDNWRYGPEASFSADGRPLSARPSGARLLSLLDALGYRYYTARLLIGMPGQRIIRGLTDDVFAYHEDLPPGSDQWQHDVGFTLDLLERLITLIQRSGATVTITMYPYRQQFESVDSKPVWNREFEFRVRERTLAHGAAFYSAFDDLRRLFDRGVQLYWSDDIHYSPVGQKAWSEAFAEYYVRQSRRPEG